MNMNYKMDAGGHWISGVSSCLRHRVQCAQCCHKSLLPQTPKVFLKSCAVQILNPFYTAYLYAGKCSKKKFEMDTKLSLINH